MHLFAYWGPEQYTFYSIWFASTLFLPAIATWKLSQAIEKPRSPTAKQEGLRLYRQAMITLLVSGAPFNIMFFTTQDSGYSWNVIQGLIFAVIFAVFGVIFALVQLIRGARARAKGAVLYTSELPTGHSSANESEIRLDSLLDQGKPLAKD